MLEPDFAALEALVGSLGTKVAARVPMPGGASTRRYFRVTLEAGSRIRGETAVAMFVPQGSKGDEIHKATDHRRWPFLEVSELLRDRGVDVPDIYAEDTERGWLLLEDLGDDTLANWLSRRPEDKPAFYTQAVEDLARAQKELALDALPPSSIVRSRAFDEDLLRWEIDHFREWGLEARGRALTGTQRATFDRIADRLARRVAELPRGFTHRDYQSRNLMVRPATRRLTWIDFQDALLGPRVYDLVALLNDSYQEFDRAFVESRLDEFARAAGLGADERGDLGFQFDLVTVQRKLKDAGRFVFIDRVNGNPGFLRFVTPTVGKVKSSLARLAHDDADMRELSELLGDLTPDEV